MVQLWDIDESKGYPSPEIVPDPLGGFVSEDDYAKLSRENAEIRGINKAYLAELRDYAATVEKLRADLDCTNVERVEWMEKAMLISKENCELQKKVKELKSLVDGAMDTVALHNFGHCTPAQVRWREDWLKRAREILRA
jgi:hypothetical protein